MSQLKKPLSILVVFMTAFSLMLASTEASAQSSSTTARNWRRGTAIVIFSGVGGGILGLSTLSFYGNPQEHAGNITVGGLLGVLCGLGYVIYKSSEEEAVESNGYSFSPMMIQKNEMQAGTSAAQITKAQIAPLGVHYSYRF